MQSRLDGGPVVLRWLRTALLGTAVGTALLGAMTTPARVTLVGAPLVGAVSVAVVVLVAWGTCSPRPSPRLLWLTGAVGVLLVPLACGLPLLGRGGGPLLVALLAALLLLGSLRPAPPRRRSPAHAVPR